MVDNTPPHSLEAEKALLGCVLADEYSKDKTVLAEMATKIQSQHFYREAHGQLYRLMMQLYTQDKPISLISLGEEIKAKKLDITIAYLVELSNAMPSSSGWEYYANIVLDKYARRNLRVAAAQILELSGNDELGADEAIGKAQQLVCDSTDFEIKTNTFSMENLYELLGEDLINRSPDQKLGLSTGFNDLDFHINGLLRPGDYVVIGARPSMGKTALTLSILINAAAKGNPVHFFSLEMNKEKLYERIVSIVTRIPHNKIVNGTLTAEEKRSRDKGIRWLMGLPMLITEKVSDLSQMWALARRNKILKKTKLIAIDYLQIINSPLGPKASENDTITAISKQIKNMATSLDVPVIALSQLNRSVESRVKKVPNLADLRGSGSLEQDADHIWLLYRDEYYDPTTSKKNIVEVHISKQRDGARGLVQELYFNPANGNFSDLSRRYDNAIRCCI